MKEDGCTYEHSEVKKARHAFARVRVSRSVVSDSSAAPWTIACQAPLSRGILQARILEWVPMLVLRERENMTFSPQDHASSYRVKRIHVHDFKVRKGREMQSV